MSDIKIIILGIVWIGVVISGLTGLIFMPNYRVRRKDHPKEFWSVWVLGTLLAVLGSYLILQTPI